MYRWSYSLTLLLSCFAGVIVASERNVLFIISDDESPTLGCYGDTAAVTPAIDSVAADGLIFRNAFATTASCSASRSVVMSGLHNHRNGQFGHTHHFHKFASFHDVAKLSLPRVMARAGYRTGRIGKYHVAPESVYFFETSLGQGAGNPVAMANRSEAFLTNTTDERPFFLYFATSNPHRSGHIDRNSPLEFKPNLFGNMPDHKAFPGVKEVFFDPDKVTVPAFLPDTPENPIRVGSVLPILQPSRSRCGPVDRNIEGERSLRQNLDRLHERPWNGLRWRENHGL